MARRRSLPSRLIELIQSYRAEAEGEEQANRWAEDSSHFLENRKTQASAVRNMWRGSLTAAVKTVQRERAGVLRGGHMTKHLLHSELHLVSRVTRVYIALHTIEIYNTLPQKQTGNYTISGANVIKYEAKYSYTTVSFFSSVQFNVHSVFVFTWLTSFSVINKTIQLWENKPVRN